MSTIAAPGPRSLHRCLGLRPRLWATTALAAFEDGGGGTVVLLQLDHGGIGEVLLELHDVADVGSPPRVHRLIVVTHHRDLLVLLGEQLDQGVLSVVGVLVLVHQYLTKRVPVVSQPVREEPQHVDHAHDEIVEVHGIQVVERLLIAAVHRRRHFEIAIARRAARPRSAGLLAVRTEVVDVDEPVLGIGDAGVHRAGRETLHVVAQIFQASLHQPNLVVLVVDGEAGAVAQ